MFVARMMLEGDIFLGFLIGFDKSISQLAVKCEVILSRWEDSECLLSSRRTPRMSSRMSSRRTMVVVLRQENPNGIH